MKNAKARIGQLKKRVLASFAHPKGNGKHKHLEIIVALLTIIEVLLKITKELMH